MQAQMDWMNIARYFYVSDERLREISREFAADMDKALAGDPQASLSALKSYVSLPTGKEAGRFLALDFGGTNVRAARIRLLGRHCYLIEKKVSRPLKQPGKYNYMSETTTPDELFDFLAALVAEAAGGNKEYPLGHTFSFGITRDNLADGRLETWAKEMAVPGVQGQYINKLLKEALERRGLTKIQPVALVNDTTALLLSAAYTSGNAQIGLVCGTGFNTCYYEPKLGMILNMESGNYGGLHQNDWDKAVDDASLQPGFHCMEKMISGAYAAEIFRRTVMTYFHTDAIPKFTTADMNELISTEDERDGQMKMGQLWDRIVAREDVRSLRNIGASIFVRSAQLAGSALSGILYHLYGTEIPPQTIAVDGSVLEHVRGALFMMEDAIQACQNTGNQNRTRQVPVEPLLIKDGPLVGGAIAAAIATNGK